MFVASPHLAGDSIAPASAFRRDCREKVEHGTCGDAGYTADITAISLCLSLFPWAQFRRAKGGVKAHVLLDHDDYMPAFVLVSKAKMHDAKALALLRLNAGSVVATDRAYNDYGQFARWTEPGVYFVTPIKDNAVYGVLKPCPV